MNSRNNQKDKNIKKGSVMLRFLVSRITLVMQAILLGSITMTASSATMDLPFTDTFTDNKISPEWSVDVSNGNEIKVQNGEIIFDADENTYAHIQRPLDVNFTRASCAIKPAQSGESYSTSLFYYWKPGDWCQIGIVPNDGGKIYVTEMREGEAQSYQLSKCDFSKFTYVAIEMCIENIRYLSSSDGNTWKVERLSIRPESYMGAPELLIVGKGYGLGETTFAPNPYQEPHLNNDHADRGKRVVSFVKDIRVEPTDPARLQLSAEELADQEKAGRDILGEKELNKPGDPSFDSVSAYYPPIQYPREVVGVKDHPFDIGVGYDATLEMSDFIYLWPHTEYPDDKCPRVYFEVGSPAVRFGRGDVGCKKKLLNGFLPVVIAHFEHDGLIYEQTILGHSAGMSPDTELYGYVRMDVSNPTDKMRKTRLVVNAVPKEGEAYRDEVEFELASGKHRVQYFKVPYSLQPAKVIEIQAEEYDQCLKEVTDTWSAMFDNGMQINVPEERINNAWRAWQAYNSLNVDKRGDVYHLCDGSGFYEVTYGYSAALYINALDLLGRHDDAQLYIDSMLTFQRPDGLFTANFGLPDNGALLFAMSQHYQMTGDDEWLRRVAPKMTAMCNFVIEQRKLNSTHVHLKRPLVYGLIYWQAYCDHPFPAVSYMAETYNCVGMEETAKAFAACGLDEEAARLKKESEAYHHDIKVSMERSVFERNGIRIMPIMPETHTLINESGYQAGNYYGLIAPCVIENNFLSPTDPLTQLVIGMIERRGGLTLGVASFRNMIDHAYGYGYLMNCLQRDEVRKVILGFYGWLSYGMTRDTYAGVECTDPVSGNNTYTLPHTYSGTQQIRLLRMMLLREDGDSLLLGYAIPSHWLDNGDVVAVDNAATTFGETSFKISSYIDDDRMEVHVDTPILKAPGSVKIRLRHPEGKPIRKVENKGNESITLTDDVIEVQKPTGPIDLVARF